MHAFYFCFCGLENSVFFNYSPHLCEARARRTKIDLVTNVSNMDETLVGPKGASLEVILEQSVTSLSWSFAMAKINFYLIVSSHFSRLAR